MIDNKLKSNKFPFEDLNPYVFVIIIIVTVFFTYQILGSLFVLISFGESFLDEGNTTTKRIVTLFAQFLLILFPVYILNYLSGNNIKNGFSLKRTKFIFYLLSIVGIILVQPVLQYYMLIQNKVINNLPFDKNLIDALKKLSEQLDSYTVKLVSADSVDTLLLVIFIIAVTPAICEELMFRGLILNTLIKSGKIKSSIILTGLIFSLFHFHPFNIIPLFFLGIFLSIVAYYSRSILPTIAVHFVNNLISVFAVYFYGREVINDSEYFEGNFYYLTFFAFVSFLLFVFITYYIIKQGKKELLNEQSA